MEDWDFFRRVLIVAGVIIAGLLLWQLSQAFLLFFGAVLFAVLLSNAADFLAGHLRMPRTLGLSLVVLLILLVFAGIALAFGTRISGQINDLLQRLPAAVTSAEQRLGLGDLSGQLLEQAKSHSSSIIFQITTYAGVALNVLSNLLLVLIGAVFLALEPERYQSGALMLVPPEKREIAGKTMSDAGTALTQWLIGQLIAMAIVGGLVGAGLWLIGLPAPLALGLFVALAEFVPILGPIIGALPAVLLAFSSDWATLGWTLALFFVVQFLESNIITPLIQNRTVSLPPVLTLFAVLAFGLLFGPLGVLFATPLAVLTAVLVARLYVRELLDEPAPIPGGQSAAE